MDEAKTYRMNVTLTAEGLALLDELAREIGSSRASIAQYLFGSALAEVGSVPDRSRRKIYKDCREWFWGSERVIAGTWVNAKNEAEAEKALRARGVSGRYIMTVVESLLDRVRHATPR